MSDLNNSSLYLEFYSTLALAVITILLAPTAIIAYHLYRREKLDTEKREIEKEIDKLREFITTFGDLSGEDKFKDRETQSKIIFEGIFETESEELLKSSSEADRRTRQYPPEERSKRYLIYNRVFEGLESLLGNIYMNFPLFTDTDLTFEAFENWVRRLNLFVLEVDRTFTYLAYRGLVHRLSIILDERVRKGEPNTELSAVEHDSWVVRLEEMKKHSKYYKDFEEIFFQIDGMAKEILKHIEIYNQHEKKSNDTIRGNQFVKVGFIVVGFFGLVVPFYMLQPNRIGIVRDEFYVFVSVVVFLFIGLTLIVYGVKKLWANFWHFS